LLDRIAATLLLLAPAGAPPPAAPPGSPPAAAREPAAALDLADLLSTGPGGAVEVSPRVKQLAGRRVRVRGWSVVFEAPLRDGFWLAPHPVFQDESGAGSGDLPPRSIRVLAPPEVVRALPPDSVPLEVIGRLEHGRQADAEGRLSLVRVRVDDPLGVLGGAPARR
jgi:hypothetical protein